MGKRLLTVVLAAALVTVLGSLSPTVDSACAANGGLCPKQPCDCERDGNAFCSDDDPLSVCPESGCEQMWVTEY